MKKLLSLLISISLLVNAISPAVAQIIDAAGKAAGRAIVATSGKELTRQLPNALYRQVFRNAVTQSYLTQIPSFSLQTNIPVHIQQISQNFQQGQTAGLGAQILRLPPDNYSQMLMRNEMVGLSLQHALPAFQQGQALSFYQEQLSKAHTLFATLPKEETLESFSQKVLQGEPTSQAAEVLGIFADAVALGLMGTEKDIPALLDFYKEASGTIFEEAASTLVGRSLLRMGEYPALNEFIRKEQPQGQFWKRLPSYAEEHGLPITATTEQKGEFIQSPAFTEALKKYGPFAALAGNFSPETTRVWVELGGAPEMKYEPPARSNETARTGATQTMEPVVLGVPAGQMTPPVAEGGTGTVSSSFAQRFHNFFAHKKQDADRATFPARVMSAEGEKRPLPLTFSIGPSFKVDGYNEVVFREDPRFENGYIVEMHDHGKPPYTMKHFYMSLYSNNVGRLVQAAKQAGVNLRLKIEQDPKANYERVIKTVYDEETGEALPLELDVQLNSALWSREAGQAFSHWIESLGLPATHTVNPLSEAKFFLRKNGEIWIQLKGEKDLIPLPDDYYVRLPKNQIQKFMAMEPFLRGEEPFEIVVSPTENRVNMVARDASLTNVSLGKTMGSVVNGSLGISEASAKSLMFFINYVLPGFGSLSTSALKKYGEKNLLTLSLGMSVAAGVLASAGGFYGFVEQMALGPVQKGLFITALFLMSGASIIKQLVTNMLINANRGEVVLSKEEKAAAEAVVQGRPEGFKLIASRVKEFFTKKSNVSLRALADYNRGFIWKNIGTLAFLSSPFAINYGIKLITGVDLGLDYSISFPLYAGYSAYVAWKVLGSKLRDAYTAKNLLQSQQMVRNMIDTGAKALTQEKEVSHTIINDVARSFKDSLDALAFAHIKIDPSQKKKLLYNDAKEKVLAALKVKLVQEYSLPEEEAQQLVERVAAALKVQENTFGNMWTMIKAPGVAALVSAMTMATVHEFVISSSFSGTMKGLIEQGEFANFLIASSLYVPLIAGRLGGNWISRRISPDSMYLFCSSLSAIGTAVMATANGSIPQTITGAVVASLGVGNFFTQMYDFIMRKYPKHNRELSAILALTMGMGGLLAIPAGYFAGQMGMGIPVDLMYASGMLAASLVLTPDMFKNSSLLQGIKQEAQKRWTQFKGWFKRGGDNNPGSNEGENPVPVQ